MANLSFLCFPIPSDSEIETITDSTTSTRRFLDEQEEVFFNFLFNVLGGD
ncbi:hypothetical protein C1645_838269 [Glomus cerebriforme]|uniref:Uncharacterized protein n=1 Tax=Glomus cerebriforme TaxID=658196 RepID=A0A397S7D9_9GLOM|nr:hypothetical protein C1645_838269 [Glomus cerebriforme]